MASQGPSTQQPQQDVETGAKVEKSTSTQEMMYLVFLSSAAAIVQCVALVGWLTAKYSPADEIADSMSAAGLPVEIPKVETGFIGLDPPLTTIVFFAALFVIPTAVATPICMFTHWKPAVVLFGSQQLTDALRGQFAAAFRMKYLYGVQAGMNGIAMISLKYAFFWPLAFNIINIVLYIAGFALVCKHFENPNVPTDLATTAASIVGDSAAGSRIGSLEQEVKQLKQELEALKNEMKALHAPSQ